MTDDHGAVLAREIYFYIVQPPYADAPASYGFASYEELVSFLVSHYHVDCVRMAYLSLFVDYEIHREPVLAGIGVGVSYPHVV